MNTPRKIPCDIYGTSAGVSARDAKVAIQGFRPTEWVWEVVFLSALIMLFAHLWYLAVTLNNTFHHEQDHLVQLVRATALHLEENLQPPHDRHAQAVLGALASNPDVLHAIVKDKAGRPIVQFAAEQRNGLEQTSFPTNLLPRTLSASATIQKEHPTFGSIVVESSLGRAWQGLSHQLQLLGLIIMALTTLGFVSMRQVRRSISGKRQLAEIARQICHRGEYTVHHLTPNTPDTLDIHEILHITLSELRQRDLSLRIAAVAFEAQEGIFVTDTNGVILRVNSAFTRITGFSESEALGNTPHMLSSGIHGREFYRSLWESIESHGTWSGEIWNRRKNGEVYPEWLTITRVTDSDHRPTHFVATFIDITERKRTEREIESLAFYDALTKLPNRRMLINKTKQALAASERSGKGGAVLFIDFDNFKILNDTLGHHFGDMLLIQVSQRLSRCVRGMDTVFHLGGDEFVVLLEGLNDTMQDIAFQAEAVCRKIIESLTQRYELDHQQWRSALSIGVALFLGDKSKSDELMKRADIAMHQAKKAGRNAVRFFDHEMQASVEARSNMEQLLENAVVHRQFTCYFQAQVNSEGDILGAEVLLRWFHPTMGSISPARFIPLAEEIGLIIPLGQWVLDVACQQLQLWQQDNARAHLYLAINVSAQQFHQPNYVDEVKNAIHTYGIDPSKLKLELTESMVLHNITDVISKMTELRAIGVRCSMDDFGTGHSSLTHLKKLPLDQLKIDQSFVRDITSDVDDEAIVQTIILMANSMGIDIVAEGVETVHQYEFLLKHGCDTFQGYLFGKPIPIEEFESQIQTKTPPPDIKYNMATV